MTPPRHVEDSVLRDDQLVPATDAVEQVTDPLDTTAGSVRALELRETLRLFDLFCSRAPMRDVVEELNRRVAIYRSELRALDSIAKAQNV